MKIKKTIESNNITSKSELDNVGVPKYIAVLDGVRALAIVMVVWFHFWQQSWLSPYITLPSFVVNYLGIKEFNLYGFVACGYIFVDLMILLSAICNFYPYARSILLQEPWPDAMTFYKKRCLRILPSYVFAVILMVILANANHKYEDVFTMFKDLFVNLFFLKTFSREWMATSQVNGVLWTVQIEFLYYLLMPWLAKLFRKNAYLMCGSLWGCSIIAAAIFQTVANDKIMYLNNNMLTYASLYANGFLLCIFYIKSKQSVVNDKYSRMATRMVSIVVFLLCLWILNNMIHNLQSAQQLQRMQIALRFPMGIVFSIMVYALMQAGSLVEKMMSNVVFKFICGISYNLYIWHQYLAVKLKEYHIPFFEGDTPPNMLGDKAWCWKYQTLCIVVAVAVATLVTYVLEKPIVRKCGKAINIK